MKYSKLFIALIVLLFSILNTSCKKFLDKKYSNSITSPIELEDLQALLDDGEAMNRRLTPCRGETSSDNYFLPDNILNARNQLEQNAYLWVKEPYSFPNDWSQSYTPVYIANYCVEALENIERSGNNSSMWDNIKGSALFYRAYNFLNLLWNHAKAYDPLTSKDDLGIVLRLGSDFNENSERASVEYSYKQVIDDAKAAISLLPSKATHVFRPSQCAAYGLLARAFLSMRIYDSAYKYANQALAIDNTLLNYTTLDVSSSRPFPLLNDEIIFYSDMFLQLSNLSRGYIDTTLYGYYRAGDLRSSAFFRKSGNYYLPKVTYAIAGWFTGIATDELVLIKAECAARSGAKDEAMIEMNRLLKSRWDNSFVPLTVNTKEEAVEIILEERRKELINRGLRWMDIKRINMDNAVINMKRISNGKTYNLPANDNYFALPLPEDVVSLYGVLQNP